MDAACEAVRPAFEAAGSRAEGGAGGEVGAGNAGGSGGSVKDVDGSAEAAAVDCPSAAAASAAEAVPAGAAPAATPAVSGGASAAGASVRAGGGVGHAPDGGRGGGAVFPAAGDAAGAAGGGCAGDGGTVFVRAAPTAAAAGASAAAVDAAAAAAGGAAAAGDARSAERSGGRGSPGEPAAAAAAASTPAPGREFRAAKAADEFAGGAGGGGGGGCGGGGCGFGYSAQPPQPQSSGGVADFLRFLQPAAGACGGCGSGAGAGAGGGGGGGAASGGGGGGAGAGCAASSTAAGASAASDSALRAAVFASPHGLPPTLRGPLWKQLLLSEGSALRPSEQAMLEEFIASGRLDESNQVVIRSDVERTRAHLRFYRDADSRRVMEVLLTFFCKQKGLRYKQGLNEVLAPFVFLMHDEEPPAAGAPAAGAPAAGAAQAATAAAAAGGPARGPGASAPTAGAAAGACRDVFPEAAGGGSAGVPGAELVPGTGELSAAAAASGLPTAGSVAPAGAGAPPAAPGGAAAFTLPDAYGTFRAFVARFLPMFFDDDEFCALQCALHMFRQLLGYHDPTLAYFLEGHGISPELYVTPWFLTLFASKLRFDLLFCLWDFYIAENDRHFFCFLSLALLLQHRDRIVSTELSRLPETLSQLSVPSLGALRRLWALARALQAATPVSFVARLSAATTQRATSSATAQTAAASAPAPSLGPRAASLLAALEAESALSILPQETLRHCYSFVHRALAPVGWKLLVLDLRPRRQFENGHLPPAINIDLEAPDWHGCVRNVAVGVVGDRVAGAGGGGAEGDGFRGAGAEGDGFRGAGAEGDGGGGSAFSGADAGGGGGGGSSGTAPLAAGGGEEGSPSASGASGPGDASASASASASAPAPGFHVCIMAADDTPLQRRLAGFLHAVLARELGVPQVSVAKGGFQEVHDLALRGGLELVDHRSEVCDACKGGEELGGAPGAGCRGDSRAPRKTTFSSDTSATGSFPSEGGDGNAGTASPASPGPLFRKRASRRSFLATGAAGEAEAERPAAHPSFSLSSVFKLVGNRSRAGRRVPAGGAAGGAEGGGGSGAATGGARCSSSEAFSTGSAAAAGFAAAPGLGGRGGGKSARTLVSIRNSTFHNGGGGGGADPPVLPRGARRKSAGGGHSLDFESAGAAPAQDREMPDAPRKSLSRGHLSRTVIASRPHLLTQPGSSGHGRNRGVATPISAGQWRILGRSFRRLPASLFAPGDAAGAAGGGGIGGGGIGGGGIGGGGIGIGGVSRNRMFNCRIESLKVESAIAAKLGADANGAAGEAGADDAAAAEAGAPGNATVAAAGSSIPADAGAAGASPVAQADGAPTLHASWSGSDGGRRPGAPAPGSADRRQSRSSVVELWCVPDSRACQLLLTERDIGVISPAYPGGFVLLYASYALSGIVKITSKKAASDVLYFYFTDRKGFPELALRFPSPAVAQACIATVRELYRASRVLRERCASVVTTGELGTAAAATVRQ